MTALHPFVMADETRHAVRGRHAGAVGIRSGMLRLRAGRRGDRRPDHPVARPRPGSDYQGTRVPASSPAGAKGRRSPERRPLCDPGLVAGLPRGRGRRDQMIGHVHCAPPPPPPHDVRQVSPLVQ
jgi:hypothetical protein